MAFRFAFCLFHMFMIQSLLIMAYHNDPNLAKIGDTTAMVIIGISGVSLMSFWGPVALRPYLAKFFIFFSMLLVILDLSGILRSGFIPAAFLFQGCVVLATTPTSANRTG